MSDKKKFDYTFTFDPDGEWPKENRLGLSPDDYEALCNVAYYTGVSIDDVERALACNSFSLPIRDPFWEPALEPPTPDEERQRAQERSRRERRRKSRKGKYKWGGSADE